MSEAKSMQDLAQYKAQLLSDIAQERERGGFYLAASGSLGVGILVEVAIGQLYPLGSRISAIRHVPDESVDILADAVPLLLSDKSAIVRWHAIKKAESAGLVELKDEIARCLADEGTFVDLDTTLSVADAAAKAIKVLGSEGKGTNEEYGK